MRLYFIIVPCAALLAQSCTSMQGVTKREGFQALHEGTEDIELSLKDGSSLIVEGGRYLLVTELGDYYFGTGTFMNYRANTEWGFKGAYVPIKIFTDTAKGSNGIVLCWRNDTSAVRFHAGDYVSVTPESGIGLYVMGKSGAIPLEDIVGVNLEKADTGKTVMYSAGAYAVFFIATVGGLAMLAALAAGQ
jgi:hypothetical protein